MRSFAVLSLLAGLGSALPQDGCVTINKQIIVPTRTATYSRIAVITEHPTTARNLGVFTFVTTLSNTTTLQTLTSTVGECGSTGVVTAPVSTVIKYGVPKDEKRALGLNPRQNECTVTTTSYTTYGQTYTYVSAGKTSTFYDYSAFSQSTVTSTKSGGTAYAVATAFATTTTTCGAETTTPAFLTMTISMDPKCSPAAMTSAYNGYGISFLSDVPSSGAVWKTNTGNAEDCCQLCATSWQCAASAWDIRTGECRLEFPTVYTTGEMNCGEGLLGYYDAGPATPMEPGTGWFVAELCGKANFGASQPDDGS